MPAHAPYRKPGRRRRRAAFPPASPYFPADVGHRRADYGAPGFKLLLRDCAYQGSRHLPFSGQDNGTAPGFRLLRRDCAFQGSRHFPFSGQGNGTAPGFRERKFSVLPNGFLCESRSRTAPAFVVPPHPMPAGGAVSVRPRSRRRGGERTVLRRTKVASRTGPPFSAAFSGAVSPRFFLLPPDGSGRHMTYRNRAIVPPRCGLQRAGSVPPRSAERRAVRRPRSGRATADGSSVFRRFQRGRFSRGFSSSRPTVRHMTYRNRAIVPPRCGLQRAGSVPPRSAERRAVRRPVPVVQPPTAPRPFMGSAPLAERIPPHRAAGCSDEEAFGDHRLFPAASPLFCRFALTKGRPLLTNGFGALIFAGSPFPVRRPLPEIKSTWGGRRRQHHGRFGRLN